jgi:hypothetical protein
VLGGGRFPPRSTWLADDNTADPDTAYIQKLQMPRCGTVIYRKCLIAQSFVVMDSRGAGPCNARPLMGLVGSDGGRPVEPVLSDFEGAGEQHTGHGGESYTVGPGEGERSGGSWNVQAVKCMSTDVQQYRSGRSGTRPLGLCVVFSSYHCYYQQKQRVQAALLLSCIPTYVYPPAAAAVLLLLCCCCCCYRPVHRARPQLRRALHTGQLVMAIALQWLASWGECTWLLLCGWLLVTSYSEPASLMFCT